MTMAERRFTGHNSADVFAATSSCHASEYIIAGSAVAAESVFFVFDLFVHIFRLCLRIFKIRSRSRFSPMFL